MPSMMKDRQETTVRMANKARRLHVVFEELDQVRTWKANRKLREVSGMLLSPKTEVYYDQIIKSLEAEAVGLAEQLADLATDLLNATQEERSRRPAKG